MSRHVSSDPRCRLSPTSGFPAAVTFNASALISCLLFLRLATGWPDLMRRWRDVELSMRSYGCPKRQRFRLNALTFTIFSIAALDYLLSQVSKMIIAIKCKGEDQELMFYFYTAVSFDQIFGSIPYALWKGILLQVKKKQTCCKTRCLKRSRFLVCELTGDVFLDVHRRVCHANEQHCCTEVQANYRTPPEA